MMEQSVPVSEVSSETANGPIPPNNSTFQNIEQVIKKSVFTFFFRFLPFFTSNIVTKFTVLHEVYLYLVTENACLLLSNRGYG